jgi:predicted molibdopterin-dependent oxidoreductase YjgC
MPAMVKVWINGTRIEAPEGTTIAVAAMRSGVVAFRRSVSGEARGPLCGMGVCFECRVTVDGLAHCRSCQVVCREGMRVTTE